MRMMDKGFLFWREEDTVRDRSGGGWGLDMYTFVLWRSYFFWGESGVGRRK